MLDLFLTEKLICEKIEPVLKDLGFRVQQFPGKTEEFFQAVTKARAFVGFRIERMQPPRAISPQTRMIQERVMNFQIIYQQVDLRTHREILNVLPVVRDALTGYRPDGSPHCLYEIEAGLVEVVQGLWLYSQMFELPIPYMKAVV